MGDNRVILMAATNCVQRRDHVEYLYWNTLALVPAGTTEIVSDGLVGLGASGVHTWRSSCYRLTIVRPVASPTKLKSSSGPG